MENNNRPTILERKTQGKFSDYETECYEDF